MAILTSKGARAPHQLKGRRNVRISRDRTGVGVSKIENIVDGLEKNIDNLDELAHENQDNIRTLSDTIKDIDYKTVQSKGTITGGDLNNYYTAGIWRTANKTVLNRPADMNNGFGQLLVISGDGGEYPTQIYSVDANDGTAGDNIYYRKCDGIDSGSWTPWQKIITDNNLSIEFPANTTIFDWLKTAQAGTSAMIVQESIPSDAPTKDEYSLLVAGYGGRKTVIAYKYFSDKVYIRHFSHTDTQWRANWVELATSESISKYTKWIRDSLDIHEYRKGYCDKTSLRVPSGLEWGSRNIEYVSENKAIVTLTGVTSDALPHHWVNVCHSGQWSGWKDTIN